jgi:hypothetical protein
MAIVEKSRPKVMNAPREVGLWWLERVGFGGNCD